MDAVNSAIIQPNGIRILSGDRLDQIHSFETSFSATAAKRLLMDGNCLDVIGGEEDTTS